MKKIIATILIAGSLLSPALSFAAPQTDSCGAYVNSGIQDLFPTHFCDVGQATRAIVNLLLGLISLAAVIFIILGGYKYVTSQGSEEAASAGRKTMTNAVIGLVIAVLAYTVVAVVSNTIGSLNPAGNNNNGGDQGSSPNAQATQNLQRSFYPTTQDAQTPFFVRINGSLSDLKVLCPTSEANPDVQASGSVTVTYNEDPVVDPNVSEVLPPGKGQKRSFSLPMQSLNVAGDQVSGSLEQANHYDAPIISSATVDVSVTYFVGANRCPVTVRNQQPYQGSQVLGQQ